MTKDIAVLVNAGGVAASLYEPSNITVYRKADGGWQILREQPFVLEPTEELAVMRKSMAEVIAFMGSCNIFVAAAVSGMPSIELEKAGIHIGKFVGAPEQFLDYILLKEAEAEAALAKEEAKQVEIPVPIEVEPGKYRISIKEIQGVEGGGGSKQAVLPFLQRGEFSSLELIGRHVPRWLEREFKQGQWNSTVTENADEVRVLITRKNA